MSWIDAWAALYVIGSAANAILLVGLTDRQLLSPPKRKRSAFALAALFQAITAYILFTQVG